MKIGFYSDAYTLTTGYGRDTLNLMLGLKGLGHEVFEMSMNHIGPPVTPIEGMPIYDGRTAPMTARLIRKLRPDVLIHIRDNWSFVRRFQPPGYDLLPFCHEVGTKFVAYTPIESIPMPKDLVDTVSTKADLTIVQSQWSKVGLIAQGAPEDRLRVLYHGVDPAVFHPGEGDREKTGLPDGPLLLSVVSNTERKGIPLTMVILAKLLGQGHDLRLYLHTPREGFYGLDTHANALGLAGKDRVFTKATSDPSPVNLSGADDAEMANLYRTASVYVTTTYGEGQGVPILEALACGLPAVMTDTPILRELYGAFPHSRFINATQNFPVPWGFDWFPDVEDGVRKVEEALDMPRPTSVEIPSFFLWKNIVRTLMGYLEDLTNGG